jgi:eukaryotic-like serine/threonine-protein kinase
MQHVEEMRFGGTARFQVLSELGQGGAGFVYEVMDRDRNDRLALKTLRIPNAESILLLKNEFRSIQDLDHPNLVRLDELFEEGGRWFFTMEYVPGKNFADHVRDDAGFDEQRLRGALGQLAGGLDALHRSGKIHRDIKPSNILVTTEGRVVILDFGIVSDLGRQSDGDQGIVGTAFYMAPEQAASETVGPASDWYAVGAMLYQCLTGKLPFTGKIDEVLERKLVAEPPPPDSLVQGLPRDLADLCVDLLRLDPGSRPSGEQILARLGVRTSETAVRPPLAAGSFVGRRAELETLESAFADASAGQTITMLVEGESGVGKSYLVREFTDRLANDERVLVLRGRCYERESVPFKAVDSVIDDLYRFLASLPEQDAHALLPDQAALISRMFPVLEQVVPAGRTTNADVLNPQEFRARVFAVLRELFASLAEHLRVVMVIDDLQWADADSVALLSAVLLPPHAPPLLLVGTQRRGVSTVARLPGDVRRIELEPLAPSEARELISSLLSHASVGRIAVAAAKPADVEAILAEAKGHPLFIDELVRHRASHGEGAAPTKLDDALWERATRLANAERRLLEIVSIAGVPLKQQLVGSAGAFEDAELFPLISALRARHFVRTSGVARTDTIEPYHDRIRESVLHHLGEGARKEWHGRLAIAIEASGDADPELLVTHWQGAGDRTRAAEYAVRAADQASAAFAFDHAAELYGLALELAASPPEVARALKTKHAVALTNAGRSVEAARVYLEAAGNETGNVALDLRRRAAEEFMCSGHMEEGNATFDQVLAAAGLRTPKTPLGVILWLLFYTLVLAIRGVKFVPRAAKDIDPRDLQKIDFLHSAGCGYGMIDHVRGKNFQIRTLLLSLRVGEPMRVARSLAYYTAASASGGSRSYAKTMQLHAVVDEMSNELQLPYLIAMSAGALGYAYQFTGQWRKARDEFVRGEEIFRSQCVDVTYEMNSIRVLVCRGLVCLGDNEELARRAHAGLIEAEKRGDLYAIVNLRSNAMAHLALVRGDVEDAQRQIDLSSRHLSQRGFFVQNVFCFFAQSYVWLYRNEPEKVEALFVEKWPVIKRSMLLHVQSLRIMLGEIRARANVDLAARGGAGRAAAIATAERCLRAVEGEKLAWSNMQVQLIRAGLAHVQGKREETLAHLETAEKGLEEVEMAVYAAAARRRRGLLLGGDEGRGLVARAEATMKERGIADVAATTAFHSPGFAREE